MLKELATKGIDLDDEALVRHATQVARLAPVQKRAEEIVACGAKKRARSSYRRRWRMNVEELDPKSINLGTRQRQEDIDVSDLIILVARNGFLQPIVITRSQELVAGEGVCRWPSVSGLASRLSIAIPSRRSNSRSSNLRKTQSVAT